MLTNYPNVVRQAGEDFSPALIANYVYDLVKEYIDIVEKREANTFGELMKKTLRYIWYELSKNIAP